MKRRQSNQLGRRVQCQLALSVALLLGASAAAFGQTETVNVTSATNSEIVVVTLVPVEGGGFTRDGEPFTGARVTLEGGFEYVVSQATDGTWMAQYQPKNVSFMLGDLGGMLTLVANEDGTFSDANGNPVVSGQNWQAGGNTYRLTLGEDGTWAGTYVQPLPQTVTLGTQGTVSVTRAEDGSWWIGETALMSGDTYSMGTNATGGANMYRLTLEDGEWSAVYAPAALDIAGTNLQATPDEDGEGYTVEGASLPKSGKGDITVTFEGADELYHIWATDDGLAGARFDYPIRSNTVWEVDVKGDVAKPSLSTDDRKTPGSELRTMVKLAGEDFSVGELLGTGSATAMPKTVLEGVRTEIAKVRNQVQALVELYNDEALTRDAFDSQISDGPGGTDKWDRADTEIAKLFGGTAADGLLERETNPRRVVDAFDAILEALATEEAFVAATADGGGGVFEFAELAAGAAQRTYNATKWSASAVFDALGSTRFGAVKRQERNNAKAASFNANEDQFQVFAWSTTDLLRRSTDVQASGTAYYTGRTHAIDSEGTFYSGTMDLSVRFARRQVSGLVTRLTTADGERWEYGIGGEVAHIFLPDATMNASGGFSTSPAGNARVSYEQRAGALEAVELEDRAELTGRLLGRGDASGSEAVGTWRIYNVDQDPTPNPANASIMLAGAFGVQRGPDRPDPTQPLVDDLEKTGAWSARAALVNTSGNGGLLTEEQYELDGSRFLPLLGVTAKPASGDSFPNAESFSTRAAARARIRELAGAVTLTNTEVDAVIDNARWPPVTDGTFTTWQIQYWSEVADVFNWVVRTKDLGARTLFSSNADAATFVVWPLYGSGGSGYRGNHPIDPRTWVWDPRAYDQVAFARYRFEINKETLFGDGYAPVSEDQDVRWVMHEIPGQTHVDLARTEITQLRDKLRSVIALDGADASETDRRFVNDRRQSIFTQIQQQLTAEIFGGTVADLEVFTRATSSSSSSAWTSHMDYPVNGSGVAQDAQLLADIDNVITALSSEEALNDAFGDGGIFAGENATRNFTGTLYEQPTLTLADATMDGQGRSLGRAPSLSGPQSVLPASHIFNKARSRLLLVTESTDFTRLGAWRVQSSRYAADTLSRVWHPTTGFHIHHQWPEPFAYSPLEQVKYESMTDRAFPSGVLATYTGKTVAVQHTQFMTGDVELKVQWRADDWTAVTGMTGVQKIGEMALTVSSLEPTNPFFNLNPALRHGLVDYTAEVDGGFAVNRPGSFDVRSLRFEADVRAYADGSVGFDQHDVEVTVTHDTAEGTWKQRVPGETYLENGATMTAPDLYALGTDGEPLDQPSDILASSFTEVRSLSGNPGHWHRDAFEHYYTKGAGKDSLNVKPDLEHGAVEGKFVGKTGEGPLSVIGTWSIKGRHWLGIGNRRGTEDNVTLDGGHEGDIRGSFGADFTP